MLKWKTYKFPTIANSVESLTDMLGGVSGKTRTVKMFATDIDADINARIYIDSEQVVDLPCDVATTAAPLVPVDIPIEAGQILKVGFNNVAAGNVTPKFSIQYDEK